MLLHYHHRYRSHNKGGFPIPIDWCPVDHPCPSWKFIYSAGRHDRNPESASIYLEELDPITREYQSSIDEVACDPNSIFLDSIHLDNCGATAYYSPLAQCVSHENFTKKNLLRLASSPKTTITSEIQLTNLVSSKNHPRPSLSAQVILTTPDLRRNLRAGRMSLNALRNDAA